MKTYDVTVTRDGRWWMIDIPDLDGLTQSRRLGEIEDMARDYIAVVTDVRLSQVAVRVGGIHVAGEDLLETRILIEQLREQARQAEAAVAQVTQQVAVALAGAQVPMRDVSEILGVSHQRVSQLVQSASGSARKSSVTIPKVTMTEIQVPHITAPAARTTKVRVPKTAIGALPGTETARAIDPKKRVAGGKGKPATAAVTKATARQTPGANKAGQ